LASVFAGPSVRNIGLIVALLLPELVSVTVWRKDCPGLPRAEIASGECSNPPSLVCVP